MSSFFPLGRDPHKKKKENGEKGKETGNKPKKNVHFDHEMQELNVKFD